MKQKEHSRIIRTGKKLKKIIVNKGNNNLRSKRAKKMFKKKQEDQDRYYDDSLNFDFQGINSKENNEYWKKFFEDKKKKVPSVKEIMDDD